MTINITDVVAGTTPMRSFTDENGELLPEHITWQIELASLMAGKNFRQNVENELALTGNTLTVSVTTPATGIIFAGSTILSDAKATIDISKGATVSGGTAVSMTNLFDGSANVSGCTVLLDPTIDVAGTAMFNTRTIGTAATGSGSNLVAASSGQVSGQMRFAQSTTYVLQITTSTDVNLCSMDIFLTEGL